MLPGSAHTRSTDGSAAGGGVDAGAGDAVGVAGAASE
ncbi:hypothetical protein GGR76_001213 [Xanthomonas translucens]|nr:hypothetical protein [Xanthomonas campestris]MCW1998316.1 hypothetical protein [Xanthomonas campestris]